MKRILSVLLVIILTVSVLPFSVFAEVTDELSFSGASYDLWVGATRVTDENKNNILNDGGKAKFDPSTNTLTLNNPSVYGVFYDGTYNNVIYARDMNLTVKGKYHMGAYDAECGIKVKNGGLTLNGDFTFMGDYYGVMAGYDINIKGKLYAIAYDKGSFPSVGIYTTSGSVRFSSDVGYAEASGKLYAVNAGVLLSLSDSLCITEPDGGKIIGGKVYKSDGLNTANHVIIKKKSESGYTLSGKIERNSAGDFFCGGTEISLEQNGEELYGEYCYPHETSYSIKNVLSGTYKMTITSFNHVDREYTVVVKGNTTQDVRICPIGDANDNMNVTSADANAVYKHVLGTKKITDPYAKKCGDVAGNGNGLTSADSNAIFKHVLGTKVFWIEPL